MLENFLVSKRILRISFFGGEFGDYLPKGVKYEKRLRTADLVVLKFIIFALNLLRVISWKSKYEKP